MHEAATGLFDLHNMTQGTASVAGQHDKTMTDALLIVKGTWFLTQPISVHLAHR